MYQQLTAVTSTARKMKKFFSEHFIFCAGEWIYVHIKISVGAIKTLQPATTNIDTNGMFHKNRWNIDARFLCLQEWSYDL